MEKEKILNLESEKEIRIISCRTSEHWAMAQKITNAYVQWLGIDLSFQDINGEMERFGKEYGPPDGAYLLALAGLNPAGGVGLRKWKNDICEMKRLFVFDAFKGKKIGPELCRALIRQARLMGYNKMRLDTLERLDQANRLYEQLGFYDIPAYRINPEPGARYMELKLTMVIK